MRPVIKKLPEEIINLISAGEVVERPVSVVKELVENSIDAESTNIIVELIDGGIKKIKVTDNGIGMKSDEIPLALMPHSTSKITSQYDLFNIHTLGFRGEALPSIASVSKFKISSKVEDEQLGFYYHYQNGKVISSGNVPMKNGTVVEVEDLFYNTPARYKHLSTNFTENSHIIDYIYKSAISHPDISFTLINNQKIIYQTHSGSTLLELIGVTYGMNIAKSVLEYENKNDLYSISGYTSNNQVFRSNKNGITIFVNNRIIKNQNIIYAITDAYKSIIPIGKYPICILKIECNPELIDVNVHPSKLEIRFTDEQQLRNLITKTLLLTLTKKHLIYQDVVSYQEESKGSDNHLVKEMRESASYQNIFDLSIDKPSEFKDSEPSNSDDDELLWDTFVEPTEITQPVNKEINYKTNEENSLLADEKNFFKKMHYIGQFHETYLLLESDDELYLIDQHAAAERVNYEKIVKELNNLTNTIATINLIVPIVVNFNVIDIPRINAIQPELEKIGIKMEYFGGTSYKVESIPLWIKEGTEQSSIIDIVTELLNKGKFEVSTIYDNIAKSVSCKKSIKAHMNIRVEEVETLLDNLDKCDMPYTCPHGRPTIIKFSIRELEKLFKRVI